MIADRHTFLREWFSGCKGYIEVRVLPGGHQKFFSVDDFEGIDVFLSKHSTKNLYFGVATRDGAGGTKANIVDIPGTWGDIDFKNIPKKEADKLISECPLQPTFLVGSGGGYQPYWRFREPTDDIGTVEHINRQLAQYFGSDPVHDASRILRLPGTANHKYKPRRIVKVLAHNQGNYYNESNFEEQLPAVRDTARPRGASKPVGWQQEFLEGVREGKRNTTATKLAGRYIAKGLSAEETFTFLTGWNQRNRQPLSDTELRGVVESVIKTDERNHPAQTDPLIFPDVMSGVAAEFAELYSRYLEVPRHFLYMTFLACLGSVLARSITLKTELSIQIRIFLILLGESADDRKSTGLMKTIQFFKDVVAEFPVSWGVNSAEGLQQLLKKHKTLLLAFDELKQFLNKCKIESSVLLPAVNTLFELNIYEAHTKGSHIRIEDGYLSLLAASTVETYERVWHSSFTAIGFNNRLWIVPGTAKRRFSFPAKIPEEEKEAVSQRLIEILKFVSKGMEIDMTPEAKEIFHGWYMGLEGSVHAKRLETYALRFMALLAINELKNEIDTETVKKALALCDWQLEVRRLYDPIDADNAIAEMEIRIRRHLETGPLRERELKRKLHRIIQRTGSWCFTRAMKNLTVAREIYFKKSERTFHVHL